MQETRIDCHVHTRYSPDGRGSVKETVDAGARAGMDGIVITDHNTIRGHEAIKALGNPPILVIPGIELSTHEGHCLGIGVRENVKRGLGLDAAVDAIVAAGGVAVPSHPYRRVHGVGPDSVHRVAKKLVAIEVFNAHDGDRKSQKAELLAIHHHLGGAGGSDSHRPRDVGRGWATFPGRVGSVDEALDLIAKQKTWGAGDAYGTWDSVRKNARSLALWAGRGFRSI